MRKVVDDGVVMRAGSGFRGLLELEHCGGCGEWLGYAFDIVGRWVRCPKCGRLGLLIAVSRDKPLVHGNRPK